MATEPEEHDEKAEIKPQNEEKKEEGMSSPIFPQDIILDILSRIPLKSLLRFRCVRKSWRNLVRNPYFVNLHLSRPLQETPNLKLVFRYFWNVYMLDFESSNRVVEVRHPFQNNISTIWGTGNGLLYNERGSINGVVQVQLWNPATGVNKDVPRLNISEDARHGYYRKSQLMNSAPQYGFGYDHNVDDYELVRIVTVTNDLNLESYSAVDVYSLRKNSWRMIPNIPYVLGGRGSVSGELVNGALHWVASNATERPFQCNLVIAFDIGGESFREVPQLECMESERKGNVTELQGKLSVLLRDDTRVDVWVMKEYGIRESWSKMFSVEVCACSSFVKLLCLTNNGILLLKHEKKLIWYDPENGKQGERFIQGIPDLSDVRTYRESIIGLGI